MSVTWEKTYRERIVPPDEALQVVQSAQRIFMTGNCSMPETLVQALARRAHELTDLELVHVLTVGDAPYMAPDMEGHIRTNVLFIGPNMRRAINEGRADFTPVFLSEIPALFRRDAPLALDVALVQVSPPDEHGFCSFGVEVGITKPASEAARIVVAEVNECMPRTLGDSFIHVSKLDYAVPVNRPLVELPQGETTELQLRIGEQVAELIPDGATLQMGIGGIPDGVLHALYNKKDLGVHTEMFSDGVIDLVEAGVITNERKTLHRGKIVAGFLLGSQRLYEFVDNNPIVEMHPTGYVNDPFVISQNDRMVAINSAIEVDLSGQVCADSIGHRFYSGVGGQIDFIRGAARSRGGVPIIALPSTASGGKFSRIVADLKPGAGVTTTRNDVHYIVTEFGIADLYGKSIRQRAQALITIAHPDFRDELRYAARELHYL
ncbi:MAG: acetyl-CoA hydrolase/transferase family protein [Chloroflexi bacterium]|nr:acetyl-CoA hydrolase/transferase family protein [Chloroflexota bacterium]